jgi:hypothetical protein
MENKIDFKTEDIKYYKWSLGESYEQTKREKPSSNSSVIETTAYLAALNHDENSWDILNPQTNNKREDIENKLSERDLISRTNMNPFMTNNNFPQDIDNFLKPKCTNLD